MIDPVCVSPAPQENLVNLAGVVVLVVGAICILAAPHLLSKTGGGVIGARLSFVSGVILVIGALYALVSGNSF